MTKVVISDVLLLLSSIIQFVTSLHRRRNCYTKTPWFRMILLSSSPRSQFTGNSIGRAMPRRKTRVVDDHEDYNLRVRVNSCCDSIFQVSYGSHVSFWFVVYLFRFFLSRVSVEA